ncbi:2-desacetyl-2-hydroxyethyl bacteriochlorophyllide A dehydrogenase [Kribbella voronezhensis]|uniref:2-desacetyl-2-hydroxyethyl bacteriochlorophyllide A dehydrogenase n=1 Tax=Kribbella voronezhensis TaxID=2512212 RepID=A0A4R7STM8_9ACTN|nr:zinc-binding alcohol dehydrogenase [Kribbella voronezhensis]TDU82414.1 2-desacetyl-2-hydroxyethyl bacteriochlorophyllide A dehydrogenase [Kribbella voronezhensis]
MARVVQFTAPRQAEVVEFQPETLPPGHVRVRTAFSGISAGTELTAYRGTNPYLTRTWDPDARIFRDAEAGVAFPVVGWGYSETGVVTELGEGVEGLAVGDEVWGIWGHRSEAVLPAAKLLGHQLPAGVSLSAAAFARVGAIAFNAILAARINLGELVAVFGQGVIGLLATRLATLSGAHVLTVDAVDSRRTESLRFGADDSFAPGTAAEKIRAAGGADTAIELSGVYAALHEAIRSVGVGGRVVASGFYQGEGNGLRLGEEFHHNRVELISSQIGGVPLELAGRWSVDRLQSTFLNLVGSGAVEVEPLISHRVPIEEAADAYTLLDTRPGDALQVLLEF